MPAEGSKKTIAILGDIMVDETWKCECNRLSPEAPVPVASIVEKTYTLGGAGNLASNIRALLPNVDIHICGFIGTDHAHLLASRNIQLWQNGLLPGDTTNTKLRVVDKDKDYHLLRVDNEDILKYRSHLVSAPSFSSWLAAIKPDLLVISDYTKGVVVPSLVSTAISMGNGKTEIFVDTRRDDITIFRGVQWITPNKHEWQEILKFVERTEVCKPTIEAICMYAGLTGIMLTRGSNGMDLFVAPDTLLHEDSIVDSVVDVTGAGDTALAAFVAARALGIAEYDTVLKLANRIAGSQCMRSGTTVPTRTFKEYLQDGHTEEKKGYRRNQNYS
jgi:D-beta-D-heptose 7-phosphate kinase/D-beta-D-heptose 1-phosphate adenosyltransferase